MRGKWLLKIKEISANDFFQNCIKKRTASSSCWSPFNLRPYSLQLDHRTRFYNKSLEVSYCTLKKSVIKTNVLYAPKIGKSLLENSSLSKASARNRSA